MDHMVSKLNILLLLVSFHQIVCNPTGESVQNLHPEEKPLSVPSLGEVAEELREGLKRSFESVDVDVVDCPDLTQKPFSLKGKGLGGSPKIVEVGSESYLLPKPNFEKLYDLMDVYHLTGLEEAFFLGAGAGPFDYVKISSEYIANSFISHGQVDSGNTIAKVVDGNYKAEILPDCITRFSLMGNFFVSKGETGKVLRVNCKKRIGGDDFPTTLRNILREAFPNQIIGLGGTFLATGSKIKQHVQPDFSATPINTVKEKDRWLKYFDMSPPLVVVGIIMTGDPGLDVREFHFHSISGHGDAGHFHYDLEPDKVEYLAYFNLADTYLRVDRPVNKIMK